MAPLQAYLGFLDRFGLDLGVLVQPSVYGYDNRCMLDALDRADGRLIGVAVPGPETRSEELETLHRRGVRGIRCNLLNPGGLDPAAVSAWNPTMEALGWHVEFHMDLEGVGDLRTLLERFRVPVVIDHMGRPEPGYSRDVPGKPPGLLHLLELVEEGACFVKLSAPYRLSEGPSPWEDVTPLARAFLEANPARCMWASDWPHVDTREPVRSEDLITILGEWCDDADVLEALMARTPASFFGASFGAS
jgi:predicted TIM-barrel fold metal-dependent hydrolase